MSVTLSDDLKKLMVLLIEITKAKCSKQPFEHTPPNS
jgi:hypothetical protein